MRRWETPYFYKIRLSGGSRPNLSQNYFLYWTNMRRLYNSAIRYTTMGRGWKGICEQSHKKQSWREEPRASNRYLMVSGLCGKPTYVDIPNDVVAGWKKWIPNKLRTFFSKNTAGDSTSVAMQIRGCLAGECVTFYHKNETRRVSRGCVATTQ